MIPFFLEWRLAAMRNGIRDAIAYRGDFILSFFSSAFVPILVQLIVWWSIFQNGSPDQTFGGMTHQQLITYSLSTLLFSQIRGGDYDFALIEMIRTGGLSQYLLRPVGVVEFTFFRGLGEKSITLIFSLFLGSIAIAFTDFQFQHLIFATLLALLGNVIHYLLGATLASISFFWESAFAVLMMKNMAVAFLSGELLPLNLFPASMKWLWENSPFYLYVFAPVQILQGKVSPGEILTLFGTAVTWLFFFGLTTHLSWRFSIHRYQSLGG